MALDARCTEHGHVLVEADPECLVCGLLTVEGDKTMLHIHRDQGELLDPRDIAGTEWGPVG